MAEPDYNDLFRRVRSGDAKAFERCFLDWYAPLCRYVTTLVSDTAAAEEIVQELFCDLWDKREQLSPRENAQAWLFRAARNRSLNHLRHLKIRDNHREYSLHHALTNSPAEPGAAVEFLELQERMDALLNGLPEQRQRIFYLSRREGKSYRDIAEELQISIKTVEANISKTLRFLEEHLRDYLGLYLAFCGIFYLGHRVAVEWGVLVLLA